MWTQVKRLKPGRFQPHVVLLRDDKGIRLYIPAHIRHQMGDPVYCDLWVSKIANQTLIQPVQEEGPHTRKLSCGSIRLPNKIWGRAVKKLIGRKKMVCVTHSLDEGNLRVDLRYVIGREKQARRGPKSTR